VQNKIACAVSDCLDLQQQITPNTTYLTTTTVYSTTHKQGGLLIEYYIFLASSFSQIICGQIEWFWALWKLFDLPAHIDFLNTHIESKPSIRESLCTSLVVLTIY